MLPRLKERFGLVRGLLLGGVIWGAWHWPVMVLAGYEYGLHYRGAPVLGMLLFCLFTTALGILLDALYVKTGSLGRPRRARCGQRLQRPAAAAARSRLCRPAHRRPGDDRRDRRAAAAAPRALRSVEKGARRGSRWIVNHPLLFSRALIPNSEVRIPNFKEAYPCSKSPT